MKSKLLPVALAISCLLPTTPVRVTNNVNSILGGNARFIHNRTNWSLNVPGRIPNPYVLKGVTLYPSVSRDREQRWYTTVNIGRGMLITDAGRYQESCLNLDYGFSGRQLTTYRCVPGDTLQLFYGVKVPPSANPPSSDLYLIKLYLIKLGSGVWWESKCLVPRMNRGYFYANMLVEIQDCKMTNSNMWWKQVPWN